MMRDTGTRRRMRFVPGGFNFQATRDESALSSPFDEWIARVVMYAFSLPPLPFVQMMNKATAETSYESALSEGLQPLMGWMKDLLDHIIQHVFGYTDLECIWDEVVDVDPLQEDASDMQKIRSGMLSIDEWRAKRGLDPLGMGPAVFGIGPMGVMFVDDLLKAKAQGLLMPQPPPAPDAGMMGGQPGQMMPGQPGQMMAGQPAGPMAAALSGIDPNLLNAVGLGAGGTAGRGLDVTQGDSDASDPDASNVVHPNVLRTLREAERRQGRAP